MTCYSVRHSISAFIDGFLPAGEQQGISLHMSRCKECAQLRDQLFQLQSRLRKLPAAKPPANLTTMLRVMASRERARRLENLGLRTVLVHWLGHGRLWMDNLMRPLALPLAGGLVSALVLLGMLVPTFYVRQDLSIKDVPFGLSTEAAMKSMSPFGFVDEDLTVVVKVDEQGRMIDYSVPGGQGLLLQDPDLRRGIESALLFAEFTPARNAFGQPIRGPIRLYLRRSQVIVRG